MTLCTCTWVGCSPLLVMACATLQLVEGDFVGIEGNFAGVEGDFVGIEGNFVGVEGDFVGSELE